MRKLTPFLFICFVFLLFNPSTVSAQQKQLESFAVVNASLEECLKEIKEKTGLGYLIKGKSLNDVKGITISMHNIALDSVMTAILKDSGYTYEIDNDVILIIKKNYREPPKKELNKTYVIKGQVLSYISKEPLVYATLFVKSSTRYTTTDGNGEFTLEVPSGKIILSISILGYETLEKSLEITNDTGGMLFYLREQSLGLDEVIVTAETTQSASGSSTYKIGEQAIQQIQPVSVKEILQLLPGSKISNPDLTSVSQVTLRTAAPENSLFANAEAFGTSVIIDGARMSNDANMQADNPTVGTSGGKNVANRGIDLRQISASTIESVEVVEGVANAKYGNMTSGAVIIKRKAGETPLIIGFNAFPSSYQLSASKGIQTEKKGSFNFNADYVLANQSPVEKKHYYQRFSSGLRWTYLLNKSLNWKNTISYDISYQLDGTRFEPEEVVSSYRESSQTHQLLNVYGGLDFKGRLTYTFNVNYFSQSSFLEDYRSDGPIPTIEATEPGTYVGGYTPLAYLTTTEMTGKPLNIQFNLDHEQVKKIRDASLSLNYGFDFSFDKNYGSGRNITGSAVSSTSAPGNRAAKFHDVPASVNYSGYLQSDLSKEFEKFSYVAKVGLRYDNMVGKYNLLSPRLSLSSKFFQKFRIRAAWGLSYKAPSMLSLYPGPTYIDIVNFDFYPNNPKERLAIISTFINQPDNSHLRPNKGETYEVGIDFEQNGFNINLTGYKKIINNGITSSPYLNVYPNQSYKVIDRPTDLPPIVIKDTVANYPRILYIYNNDLYTKTDGFSFHASFPKINLTNTKINVSGAYNYTFTENNAPRISSSAYLVGSQATRFGRYNTISYTYESFRSNLTLIQHIPAIKLLITFIVEQNWINKKSANDSDIYPIGYYNLDGTYTEIPESQRMSPEYENLHLEPTNYQYYPEPAYSNFHLQLRKETKQGHSFSFYANNFWWHNPIYYDDITIKLVRLNSSVSFGLGVTFKL